MWPSISPGNMYLPEASTTVAAGGSNSSEATATILPSAMAMAASAIPEGRTTFPPRTIIST